MRCPRCEENDLLEPVEKNAISEIDRKTWICTACGRMESVMKFFRAKNLKERIPKKELEFESRFKMRLGL